MNVQINRTAKNVTWEINKNQGICSAQGTEKMIWEKIMKVRNKRKHHFRNDLKVEAQKATRTFFKTVNQFDFHSFFLQWKLTGARWSVAELLKVWDGVTKHPLTCCFLTELTAKLCFYNSNVIECEFMREKKNSK